MSLFNRVTIVGLGLIGGSLGMAVKRRGLAREVVGVSRSTTMVRRAQSRRAIDWGTTDLARGVKDADLVVLATPVDAIIAQGSRAARAMRRGSILTDVGSTKASIVRRLERAMPRGVAFVGAHPLAGSEQQGIEAAEQGLFDGSVCVLTPTAHTSQAALRRVRRLWLALADEVITMRPARHDQLLACTSHLPHLLAFSLTLAIHPRPLSRAPRSFLDVTRIAKSNPTLWDDIFLTNRKPILSAMAQFERSWRQLRACLAQADRARLRRLLAQAKAKRDALQDS